jgi:hypothetical protein
VSSYVDGRYHVVVLDDYDDDDGDDDDDDNDTVQMHDPILVLPCIYVLCEKI